MGVNNMEENGNMIGTTTQTNKKAKRISYSSLAGAVYPMFRDYVLGWGLDGNAGDWHVSIYKCHGRYYNDYENDSIPASAKYVCDFGDPSDWEFESSNIDEGIQKEFGEDIWDEYEEIFDADYKAKKTFLNFLKEKHPELVQQYITFAEAWAGDIAEAFEAEHADEEDEEDNF
jgi:hypothetical protein